MKFRKALSGLMLLFIPFMGTVNAFAVTKGQTPVLRTGEELSIAGTIKDIGGQPLPGVSIMVKGTRKGVSSNGDGKFTLKVQPTDILVFSLVGYRPQEITVGSKTQIEVTLEIQEAVLGEVVVTAIGSNNKKGSWVMLPKK